MNTLPYSEIFVELLVAIHRALAYCHSKHKNGGELSESDEHLNKIFESFSKIRSYRSSGLDAHIVKGLTLSESKRKEKNLYPRITKIVIHAYIKAQKTKSSGQYQAEIIPSPLNILYHVLTVPEEPQTAAYSFVLCRGMLFYFLDLHPKFPDLKNISPGFDEFREEDILSSVNSFNNYINIHGRWPEKTNNYKSTTYRTHYLNGHILSIKGYTYLWFNNSEQLLNFCDLDKENSSLPVLKKLYTNSFSTDEQYYFRLSGIYTTLPDASEINNWIFGVPIPLRGADLLFYGGLKKTSTTGLVISLHGQPGSGKTSAALSLAAVLSPFNTKTFYLSLEENSEDLKTRLSSLIPDYLRRLSIYEYNYYNQRKTKSPNYELDWFTALKFSENITLKNLTDLLAELKFKVLRDTIKYDAEIPGASVPATCPLLIVIDNVNELFINDIHNNSRYKEVENFIEQCRNMGAFVLLIAADDIPGRFRLDYLVDVAIHLKQEGLNSKYEKPVRVLQLLKTRHQVSRQGSHVFHLSNSRGFRISPQVPSQMDKREKVKIELPSRTEFIHTLNFFDNEHNGYRFESFLPIASNSQILIHGHGSSGKAGFGLKILLTPRLNENLKLGKEIEINRKNKISGKIILENQRNCKVLIISFLYPEEYYHVLHDRITNRFGKSFNGYDKKKTNIRVKAFYPGFLTPEDFVYKIVRALDEAQLEGEPYTGIMFDGLHNVFLQFKNLQESHMIWPLLYSMLYRYSLTVVTTFTNFSLNDRHSDYETQNKSQETQNPDDFMLLQQGQKPFLHGLVKAADYFFMLEEINDPNQSTREYWISVRSSIRKIPPLAKLKWDREELAVMSVIDSSTKK